MNGLDIEKVTEKLASATVDEEKEVSFAGKGLKLDTENDAQEIVKAIKNCPGMTCLRLEGNTIGVNAAKAIAKALESQPKLKKALWKDMFTRRTEKEIPEALNFLTSGIMLAKANLVELDLSDNAFGPRGLKGIVLLLKSPPCYTLKELRLNNNGLGISGGKMLAEALSQCLVNSRNDGKPMTLKVFVCGRNRLENEGAKLLAGFLKDIGTLESIAMPQNGIYHEGVSALAEAFASNSGLKELNLEDNSLTEKGAKAIAKLLPSLKSIEVLNFGDCLIRNEGALALSDSLRDNCPLLKVIHLGFNEIGKEGGIAIAEAMVNKENLLKIEVNGNQFGMEGCQIIEGTLETIGRLTALGSLSEDEGAEDDDYDEEDDDGDYNEEDEEEEEEDEKLEKSLELNNRDEEENKENKDNILTPISSPMLKVTARDFISNPSADKLIALGNASASLLLDELSHQQEKPSLDNFMELFIKISSVVKPDDKIAKLAAYECADAVLSKAFIEAENEESLATFNNIFLVHLGLIKCEDKKFKPPADLSGPLIVLEHAVKQAYFCHATRDILQLFLSRPIKAVEACGKIKHALMQTLFQM